MLRLLVHDERTESGSFPVTPCDDGRVPDMNREEDGREPGRTEPLREPPSEPRVPGRVPGPPAERRAAPAAEPPRGDPPARGGGHGERVRLQLLFQ